MKTSCVMEALWGTTYFSCIVLSKHCFKIHQNTVSWSVKISTTMKFSHKITNKKKKQLMSSNLRYMFKHVFHHVNAINSL